MNPIIETIIGTDNFKLNDQIIANTTLMGMKGAAVAYLGATLESSTPELRRLWSSYLSEAVLAHEGMTNLAMKKGWYKPYINPDEQISQAFKGSEWVLNPDA